MMTTGPSGTFTFEKVPSGRIVVSVAASSFAPESITLDLARDTVIRVTLKARIISLDPMLVHPTRVDVRGTVVDSATNDPILFAVVNLYPANRTVDVSNIGRFRFDTVPGGPTILVAEAMEHLPVQVRFDARRDTNFILRLPVDSVAVRMMARQATRLQKRSQAVPYNIRSADRNWISREGHFSVGELVDRMMPHRFYAPVSFDTAVNNALRRPVPRSQKSAQDACFFLDDRRIAPGILDGLYPELIERIEMYRNGGMVRVYSKRYVMSLTARAVLPKITFIPTALRPVCE